jgi:hypothetical protein
MYDDSNTDTLFLFSLSIFSFSQGVYILAIVFAPYLFIGCVATTEMTWDEALVAVMVAAVVASFFFVIAFAFWAEGMCTVSGMRRALRVERPTYATLADV